MGRETVKRMNIQRPVLLPQNQQQNSADPGAPSVQVIEKNRALYSSMSPEVPNTGLYTEWTLDKCANN